MNDNESKWRDWQLDEYLSADDDYEAALKERITDYKEEYEMLWKMVNSGEDWLYSVRPESVDDFFLKKSPSEIRQCYESFSQED